MTIAAPHRLTGGRRIDISQLIVWTIGGILLAIVLLGSILTLRAGHYTAAQWRDFVVFGIAQGAIYALIALGYTMVYGVLRMINFAHGEVFMSGAMTTFFLADYLNRSGFLKAHPWISLIAMLLFSGLVSMTVAVLVERIAYRPLRGAPRLVPLITAVGASFFLQYTFRGLFGSGVRAYPAIPVLQGKLWVFQKTQVAVFVGVLITLALLVLFLQRTRAGLAIRAVAEDREAAALMGVDVDRAIVTTFAVGGFMAGIAGVLYALVFVQVQFFMGFLPGIKAFTAAVLGGIGNLPGAALGGLVLGVVESVGPSLFFDGYGIRAAHQLKDVIAFTILVLILIFRPTGLLGERLGGEGTRMIVLAARRAIFIGLVAGIAGWHLSLVGLIPAFAQRRLVGDTLTLSYALVVALLALAAYATGRRYPGAVQRIPWGILSALVSSLMLFLLALLVTHLNLRQIFLNATPELARVLTFGGGSSATGLIRLLVIGLLTGLFAGALSALPRPWGRVVVSAVLMTLLLGLLRDVLAPLLPQFVTSFLYGTAGLSLVGALVTFLLAAVLFALRWSLRANAVTARATAAVPATLRQPVTQALLLLILASVPLWAGLFLSNVADFVGFYILMGLGLNLVLGFAGLLDLGYVAFFAVGAYTMAVLTSPEVGQRFTLDFWVALPIAIVTTVLAGILVGLPVLRMRGDYLAIATLGFGEIVRLLVLSDWLKPYLGGAQGVTRIARPSIASWRIDSPQEFYLLVLLSCLFAWFLSVRLRDSRLGRSWFAIREDEHVAQAMGINRVTAKLSAFAIGASFGGLSGALFASLVGSVVPASFSLLVSINVVALLVLGGMGSLPGVVVGALALVGLPELLREFQEYRLLVYGIVLIAMMLFRPAGLLPERIHRRELEEAVEEAREIAPAEIATGRG